MMSPNLCRLLIVLCPSTFILHQDVICSSSFSSHPAFPRFMFLIFSFVLSYSAIPGTFSYSPLPIHQPHPGRSFASVTHVCPCLSVFRIPHVLPRAYGKPWRYDMVTTLTYPLLESSDDP